MKKLFLLLVLICISGSLSAQNDTPGQAQRFPQHPDGGFSIHFGGAFPLGNFGEEPYNQDPFETGKFSAGVGFNVGIKGKFPISATDGLGVFVSADLIYNGLKGLLRDEMDETDMYVDVKKPKYLNIPVFVGLNYRYDFSPKTGIWIEGGAGPNFRKITNEEYSSASNGALYTSTVKYKMQTGFGFQIGGGLMLNDTFSIGVHYYGLGKSTIKGDEIETENGYSDSTPFSIRKKSPQNVFILRLGYHF